MAMKDIDMIIANPMISIAGINLEYFSVLKISLIAVAIGNEANIPANSAITKDAFKYIDKL